MQGFPNVPSHGPVRQAHPSEHWDTCSQCEQSLGGISRECGEGRKIQPKRHHIRAKGKSRAPSCMSGSPGTASAKRPGEVGIKP
eukprot:1156700-Pelagomonas_calceolata.AAC.6